MKKILLLITTFLLLPVIKVNAASSSFYIDGGGTVYTGNVVNVVVYANSSDSYNAVTANVSYSNLTLLNMSISGGWTGVSGPSDSGGTISFSGALLGSSASGSRAVLNLSFRVPYYESQSSISSTGTVALADGNGTLVNGGGNTVTYNVINPPAAPPSVPDKVTISSSTNPEQTKWTNISSVNFSWNKQDGVDGFSYTFDNDSQLNPDETAEGTDTSKSYDSLKEGANYFHIRAHNSTGWSEQATYIVLFDSKAPDPFEIAKLENETKEKYILYFATNDSTSGVDYYTLNVDGIDMGKQETKYQVDKTVGVVEVTAFDKAGNSITGKLIIKEVSSPVEETNKDSNIIYSFIGITLIIILALAAWTAYFVKRRRNKINLSSSAHKIVPTSIPSKPTIKEPESLSNSSTTPQ